MNGKPLSFAPSKIWNKKVGEEVESASGPL